MDHDGWWAYVYPKSLDLQDRPKLAVPRLCRRLRAAVDLDGSVYFDNVDVNGIIARDDQLLGIAALLNSRPLDFMFRRGSVPFQNDFFSANKQFISWLPISTELPDDLETAGTRLHEIVALAEGERSGFLDWLSSVIGARVRDLAGVEVLTNYSQTGLDGVLAVLDKNASRLTIDPRRRAERERIGRELTESTGRITDLDAERALLERDVDAAVYDAYGLSAAQQARVASEYE